ncbi:sodium:solute symporter family protein [Lentibacillus jeotgali]|uniref:sodium:solute symporter family protein n=1 Tax=Lentibacillus jeotgali TaxID=558169 RepID=UPI000262745A|nr:sodium:solute symporter family protein [Lentibacillus jeotgali]
MASVTTTIIVLSLFLIILLSISFLASRSNISTPDDFYLANRGLGTIVMVMTTGASFFSTWTLLGAVGSYYRGGVWFIAFAAWAIVHAMFIWIFGARIWYLGKKYNFVTPGELIEKYYKSSTLRLLFAVIGIIGLVPYMLIQVTGGASALNSLTGEQIPYWIGVLIMGAFVGLIVTLSGGRGAAWSDTFMGFFFGFVLIFITAIFFMNTGGVNALKSIENVAPEILTNHGDFWGIFDTALGLGLGYWVMPHMWQKFYSAKSPMILAKTSVITPFWNSWLMACGALFIGILAHYPGLVPGITAANSDQIIPVFFSSYAPIFGSIVVAAILAAGISTINSQMLSSASLLVTDIYVRFFNKDVTVKQTTVIGKTTVLALTGLVVLLSFLPAAQGFLVPLASLGFAISIQLVPAAIGPLLWRKASTTAAILSIIVGEVALTLVYLLGSPLPMGPAASGIILASIVFFGGSLLDNREPSAIQNEFHDTLVSKLYGNGKKSNSYIKNTN